MRHDRNKRTAAFWKAMGPLFANATVHRELQTLHDEPESDEWFVGLDSKEAVAWFACLRIGEESAELCHYWVRPADREKDADKKRITDTLIARAKELAIANVFAIAGPDIAPDLEKRGFAKGTVRGKYVRMEKSL